MENTSWHSYPKVYALGHAAIGTLLDGDVIIEEKIDGSQFSFGVFDGKIYMKSRGKDQTDAVDSLFSLASETVHNIAPILIPGWTYRTEYLHRPKHNALCYDRVPLQNLIVFDINTGHEKYLSYGEKNKEADRIGLECVPLISLGRGKDYTPDMLLEFFDHESILGGCKIEGIVVKNYLSFGRDGKVMMGKYVSENFKEKHNKEWKNANPGGKDMIQLLGETYRHEGRWEKAIQHLRDRGELTNSPQDIGSLIKEIQDDINLECGEEIKEQLYKWAFDHIRRQAVRGLPEWYKRRLLESQFGNV